VGWPPSRWVLWWSGMRMPSIGGFSPVAAARRMPRGGSGIRGAVPLRLVRAAILAANAHNAQVWRFALTSGRIEVWDDVAGSLGTVDTYRREIHLSAGCAIENLVIAASAAGLVPTVRLAPTSDRALLASVDLAPGSSSPSDLDGADLYGAIPYRHTDRGAYQRGRGWRSRFRPAWTPSLIRRTFTCCGCWTPLNG
jgi:hypothetical protein